MRNVNVTVLGRSYKLTIPEEEEQFLRKAVQRIETQSYLYGKNYGYNNHQDLLAMVAISMAKELVSIQENLKYKEDSLIEKLTEIDSLLEHNLHPTQHSL